MVGVSIINLGRHCPGRPAGDTQETLMPSRPTRATGAFSSQSLIIRLVSGNTEVSKFKETYIEVTGMFLERLTSWKS